MRPPRVRHISFARSCPIYCYALAIDYWASLSYARLPCGNSLIRFLFVITLLRHQLPSDSTSRWITLPRLTVPIDTARSGLSPPRNAPCLASRRRGCYHPHPSQSRTSAIRASGSSQCRFSRMDVLMNNPWLWQRVSLKQLIKVVPSDISLASTPG